MKTVNYLTLSYVVINYHVTWRKNIQCNMKNAVHE